MNPPFFSLFFVEYLWSAQNVPKVLPGIAGTYIANESTGSYGSLQKGPFTLWVRQGFSAEVTEKAEAWRQTGKGEDKGKQSSRQKDQQVVKNSSWFS